MAKWSRSGRRSIGGGKIAPLADARLTARKCRVCEWEGEIVERPTAVTDCPSCHGLTDVVRLISTDDALKGEKNPHAAALGRLGGVKGGYARAAALTAKRRSAIATRAAKARWNKTKPPKG
jgi:hypothetical protein